MPIQNEFSQQDATIIVNLLARNSQTGRTARGVQARSSKAIANAIANFTDLEGMARLKAFSLIEDAMFAVGLITEAPRAHDTNHEFMKQDYQLSTDTPTGLKDFYTALRQARSSKQSIATLGGIALSIAAIGAFVGSQIPTLVSAFGSPALAAVALSVVALIAGVGVITNIVNSSHKTQNELLDKAHKAITKDKKIKPLIKQLEAQKKQSAVLSVKPNAEHQEDLHQQKLHVGSQKSTAEKRRSARPRVGSETSSSGAKYTLTEPPTP